MAEIKETPKPTETSKDARMWGMLCHLLGLFTSFVGPLIIWLLKKAEDPFIDDQGKEALNFQITLAIAFIAVWIIPILLKFLSVLRLLSCSRGQRCGHSLLYHCLYKGKRRRGVSVSGKYQIH